MFRKLLLVLSPLAGIGVVAVVLLRTGTHLGEALGVIPVPYHLGALGAFLLSLLGRGARITFLARGLGTRLSLEGAISTQLTGEAAAAVTPSRSGSDPARILFLRKLGLDLPTSIAVLTGEIMAEGVVLGGLIAVLLCVLPGHRGVVLGALPYAAASLTLPILAFLLLRRSGGRRPPWIWEILGLGRLRWRRIRSAAWRFRSKAVSLRGLGRGTVSAVLLASMVHALARLSILPLLAAGLPLPSALGPLVAWPLLLLYTGSLLPPPGGGGAVELTFVAALTPVFGEAALPGLLLWWRMYTFYLGASLGAILLFVALGRAGWSATGLGQKAPKTPGRRAGFGGKALDHGGQDPHFPVPTAGGLPGEAGAELKTNA